MIVGIAFAVIWYGRHVSFAQQVFVGCLLLLGAALVLRLSGVALLGPSFAYDLVRSARRGRHVIARSTYAGLVLAALLLTYAFWLGDNVHAIRDLFTSTWLPPKVLARFASTFFGAFVAIQLLATIALTPAYVAGVIAQERQRGTLDALLATDLRSREIVLGLLLSRLANLALLVAAGLPILSLVLLWGGVDPELVLATFAGTGLTMVSLAGVSIFQSVNARRPRDAILRTYVIVAAFLVVSSLMEIVLLWSVVLGWDRVLDHVLIHGEYQLMVRDLLDWSSIGNPLVLVYRLSRGVNRGGNVDILAWHFLRDYGIVHLLIAFLCIMAAVVRLRLVAQRQTAGKSPEFAATRVRQRKKRARPPRWTPVAGRGMLWKETVVEARLGRGALGWFWLGVRVTVLFWLAIHICFHLGRWLPTGPKDSLVQLMNFWVRTATVLMACFMLLAVAVRAAGSVSGERDRQTLDGLLVTPLENGTLLFSKWLGSILSVRGAWLRLGIVWSIGILMGALHPLAAVCLLITWFVFAALLSSLGLWLSVVSRSAHRAIVWTVLFVLGALLVPAMVVHGWLNLWYSAGPEMLALMPLHFMAAMAFSQQEYDLAPITLAQLLALAIPLGLWSLAAGGLYLLAGYRFRALTGRDSSDETFAVELQTPSAAAPSEGGRVEDGCPAAPKSPPVMQPGQGTYVRRSLAVGGPGEQEYLVVAKGPRWSRHLRNAVLLLLPLALLLAWYGYLLHAVDRDLQDAIAEADRLDPQWRLEEIEANRLKIPDDQNSALQVMKVRSLLPKGSDTLETAEVDRLLQQDRAPEFQLKPREIEAVRTALAKAQPALAEARRLSDMPNGSYPISWSRDGFSTQLPHVQEARMPPNLLALDVLLRAQEKDADGALASCTGIVNAGRSISDTPLLISVRVRRAIVQSALERIERTLAQGEPSEAALAALQRLLEDEDRQPLLLIGLRGERGASNRCFEALRSGEAEAARLFGVRLPWDLGIVQVLSGSLKSEQAKLLRSVTQLVEAAKLPAEQQDARFSQIAPPRRMSLAGMFYPAMGSVIPAHRLEQAQVRCTLTALAVERYRRQQGQWPSSLTALVPGQIDQVPLDPYDGQPLRYARLVDGVVVYSLGQDLTDNGGKLDRKNPGIAGTDVGMRLWDNSRRRQLPP